METLQPGFSRLLFKLINDLALTGGRPGDQEQDVKHFILFHCNLPTRTSRRRKDFTTIPRKNVAGQVPAGVQRGTSGHTCACGTVQAKSHKGKQKAGISFDNTVDIRSFG
jgi:hypothetical protein